jgi:PleD family two-component response regulator
VLYRGASIRRSVRKVQFHISAIFLLSSEELRCTQDCLNRNDSVSLYPGNAGSPSAFALPEVIVLAPAKILVVDDQEFVRRTLCSLLDQQPHWKVYEAEDGIAAVDRALEIKPDVVVMDIAMPNMSGIAAAYELRQVVLEAKVILISSHYTEEAIGPS